MPLCPSLFKPPYLLYTPPFIMHLSLIGALKKKINCHHGCFIFVIQTDFTEAIRTECNLDYFRSIDGTVKDLKKHQFPRDGSLASNYLEAL